MPILHISFAFSEFLEEANSHLIPCPVKYLTGYDCPGCGFQRSLIALLDGNVQQSVHLYPATIPLIFTFLVSIIANFLLREKSKMLINGLFMLSGSIVVLSYIFKISGLPFY